MGVEVAVMSYVQASEMAEMHVAEAPYDHQGAEDKTNEEAEKQHQQKRDNGRKPSWHQIGERLDQFCK